MSPDDRARTLADLAVQVNNAEGEQRTADAIIEGALDLVPDADWVSLTVRGRRGAYTTLAATHEEARRLDELQYDLGEGPCVDAFTAADWYRSGVVREDPRWPRWGPRAGEEGAGSLLSVQLLADDGPVGALNMYARREGGFADRDEIDLAVLTAVHVAIALASARRISGLEVAMASRHTIGVAQGMLMERYGISLEAAFAVLRRYSSIRNIRLAELARKLVETGEVPDDPAEDPALAPPAG